MKIVDEKWVYTGPIQLYLFNIPTPLWLPFGFLPATTRRTSGPLPPTYGEDDRGFYLRDWGWYFAISDYMDAQVQFGIWTRGSWQVAPAFRYAKRYRYSGSLGIDYIRNRSGERGDPAYTVVNTSSLRWSHNQTLSPTARFSSNVNLSSSSYLRTISQDYDDRVRQSIGSSISYNKRWDRSGRALGLNLNHRQVIATGQTNLTLPSLTFSQGSRKPFARDVQVGRERWYEKITYSYSGSLQNQYNYTRLPDQTLIERGEEELLGLYAVRPSSGGPPGRMNCSISTRGTASLFPPHSRSTGCQLLTNHSG
jgi:lipopolysaccharide assembly outer membrane protein LptD (OstA)